VRPKPALPLRTPYSSTSLRSQISLPLPRVYRWSRPSWLCAACDARATRRARKTGQKSSRRFRAVAIRFMIYPELGWIEIRHLLRPDSICRSSLALQSLGEVQSDKPHLVSLRGEGLPGAEVSERSERHDAQIHDGQVAGVMRELSNVFRLQRSQPTVPEMMNTFNAISRLSPKILAEAGARTLFEARAFQRLCYEAKVAAESPESLK